MRQLELVALAEDIRSRFGPFVREVINPGADARDREGATFPHEMLREVARAGLWSTAMPAACGGGGADPLTWGITLEQLGYLCEDGSFPLLVSIRTAVASAIHQARRPDLDERYVRPMVRCERFGSFAYSDDTDAFSFKSSVRRDGDDLIVEGEKMMVTGGASADVFMTYLRDAGSGDLVVALIERTDPGVEVVPVEVTGLRSAGLASLRLGHVRLPADRVLHGEDGVSHAQRFLNDRRVLLAAGPLGRMQAIFETCIDALGSTIRYGRPLIEMQNVQASIGRMYAGIASARALLHLALQRLAGLVPGYDPMFDPIVSAAKYTIGERAVEVATRALRLLGGRGYTRDLRIERYLRDFHGLLAGGGAQDVLEVDLGIRTISDHKRRTS